MGCNSSSTQTIYLAPSHRCVIKRMDSIRKERRRNHNPTQCVMPSYQTIKSWPNYIYVGALRCNHSYQDNKEYSSYFMSNVLLVSSTTLFMRDAEEKVLIVGNIFYNALSAWKALYRYHYRNCCQPQH